MQQPNATVARVQGERAKAADQHRRAEKERSGDDA
jgi:hypothetical protein